MASPQLEDGFIKYAHELDAALALADFTKYGRLVLREAFAQTYGPAARTLIEISPSEIAKRAGYERQHVSRGFVEVREAGVLVLDKPTGLYRFDKNYENWTKNGKPRLDEAARAYCRNAKQNVLAYAYATNESHNPNPQTARTNSGDKPAPKQVTPTTDTNASVSPQLVTDCHLNWLQTVTSIGDKPAPKQVTKIASYIGPRAEERELRIENTTKNEKSVGPILENGTRTESEPETSTKTDDLGTNVGDAAPSRDRSEAVATPAEIQTLGQLLEWSSVAVPEIEDLGGKLPGFVKSYGVAWVHQAIQTAIVNVQSGGVAKYMNACLLQWKANGGPPHAEPNQEGSKPGGFVRSARPSAANQRRREFSDAVKRMPVDKWAKGVTEGKSNG